jgi:hypothetical protein
MYVDAHEAAEFFDVHHSTVLRWCREGEINTKIVRKKKYVPIRALINYLVFSKKFPTKSVEPDAVAMGVLRQHTSTLKYYT